MGKSIGQTIKRERAARLNGKLIVESRPAGGTVIRLVFPQRKPEHAA
jgi:two-component system nitrate/nitrite sensor histidine kinase NarX